MKHRNQDNLLKEVFADEALDALREDSLAQGLNALHQRRKNRAVRMAALSAIPLALLTALVLWHAPKSSTVTESPVIVASASTSAVKIYPATSAIAAPPIAAISDDELLAMFKDRSVGLLGSSGQQKLVFFD